MCLSDEVKKAHEKYREAKERLDNSKVDPDKFAVYAKEANDAWLEFKKLNNEYENYSITKLLGELYNC